MAVQYFSPQTLLLTLSILLPLVRPFTVITSDSDVPSSALIDGPQPAFSTNQNGARTDPREQEAVYEIMRATGNDWATDISDVCRGRWHGIECMPDKENVQHVVSLSFGALSDDTAFPTCDPNRSYVSESITKLPHLRTLFFFRCFSNNPGRIPTFLGQLGPTLQTLVLRDNGFVGPIPSELGNLTRLRILDLHKNNLNGSIPVSLGRLTGLMSLDLSWNKLTGSIPGLSFPPLNVLDLSQNLLMGPIPSSIGGCQSLIKMDFSRNQLTGSIPDSISGLKDLILMDISYNRLSILLPATLKSLNSLQVLNLKGNPMATTSLPNNAFDGMRGLMFLILSNMNMHGSIPESIGRLSNLRVIYLDGNRFNGSIPNSFRNLRNLSELRLNDNQLSGPIPLERETVWRMKRKLRLHNNSGLCYNPNSGFEDGLDPSFSSGIGSCITPTPTPGSTRTVQP
ncbi:Leucine-rich repeat (LRR) family protein [Tripterygium wilfordii]|uniref:non-specific serine/threonine protein kinase n=1 Tax=Tripterygium wilfordii TaxID=458696 RepID=A0A7J7CYA3_TRIWF|nr:protein TOO MANY MOUTHS [Tripterygium wilfordii]KAF5739085.1 Leucine-rich repeat (LRR) family protein [Tripterygium wilfordii]